MNLHPNLVTELISHSYSRYPDTGAEQRWSAHLHAFHQFDATLEGQSELHLPAGQTISAQRGTGILIPPMLRHQHRTRSGFRVAMFKFRLAPAVWQPMSGGAQVVTLPAGTLAALEEAAGAWEADAPYARVQSTAALTLCLVTALRSVAGAAGNRSAGTPEPPKPAAMGRGEEEFTRQMLPLLEAVEADPWGDWTVAGLAQRCHLTPDHFTKRFQAAFEQGPQAYLRQAKMRAAAAALVSDPRISIKAVAQKAGYATVHSFSRAFREVTGMAPARYRREPGEL